MKYKLAIYLARDISLTKVGLQVKKLSLKYSACCCSIHGFLVRSEKKVKRLDLRASTSKKLVH